MMKVVMIITIKIMRPPCDDSNINSGGRTSGKKSNQYIR